MAGQGLKAISAVNIIGNLLLLAPFGFLTALIVPKIVSFNKVIR